MDLRPGRSRNWKLLNYGETLEGGKDKIVKKDRTVLADTYEIERIITTKMCPIEGKLYLVHWKEYPIHEVTWEPRQHIPDSDIENYNNPQIPPECVQIYSRLIEEAIQCRLASRNSKVVVSLPTDVYRCIFGTDSTAQLDKDTFSNKLVLSPFWYCKFNVHGQGVQLNFPVKVESSVYFRTVYVPEATNAVAKKVPVERLVLTASTSVCSL